MNEDNLRMELLLDDHRGIYIPQGFAQEWAHAFTYPGDPEGYAADVAILARGPDAVKGYDGEEIETWMRVLDNAVGRSTVPHFTYVDTMATITAMPDDPSWGLPNPFAGWKLDQGGCEDGCVRAYHPDDGEALFGGGE